MKPIPASLSSTLSPQILLLAAGLFWLNGCATTNQPSAALETPGGQAVDWKADFLRQRDAAEANARLAKATFQVGSLEMNETHTRYQRARNTVNLLLEDIQNSIRANRDPMSSGYYPGRARAAEEALVSFNNYVQRNALPPEKQPKVFEAVLPIVTGLGGAIWDRIAASSDRHKQERTAALERVAGDLDTVRFPEFDAIPASP